MMAGWRNLASPLMGGNTQRRMGYRRGRRVYHSMRWDNTKIRIGGTGITRKYVVARVEMAKYKSPKVMGGLGSVTTKGLPDCGGSWRDFEDARTASK